MKKKEYTKEFGCACCRYPTKKQQRKIIKKKQTKAWKKEWL